MLLVQRIVRNSIQITELLRRSDNFHAMGYSYNDQQHYGYTEYTCM